MTKPQQKNLNITKSITLPCGQIIKNRIVKSAMSENMASNHSPNSLFEEAYRTWGEGEIGLIISGNVMVDENQLGEPHNIVLNEKYNNTKNLKSWTRAAKASGSRIWMQINHPGKQTPNMITKEPVAPSAIAFPAPMDKAFNTPRELTNSEIENLIISYALTAKLAMDADFDGVQIHGAHGYLVSQFLSPKHNQRTDKWGGTLENRTRFVVEIAKAIRASTSNSFGIGIKLNSADFQKGGFTEEESMEVAKTLDKLGLDLIEISGGTYENAIMMGDKKSKRSESTIARESYFLKYAEKLEGLIETPLMVTGGFRTLQGMEDALASGSVQMVGIGRPFCVYPNLVKKMIADPSFAIHMPSRKLGVKTLDALIPMEIIWYTHQIQRMGKGFLPKPNLSPWTVVFKTITSLGRDSIKRVRSKS